MPTVPDLPGTLVPPDQENWLKSNVARLCHVDHQRFPGSQPVSFGTNDLDKLEQQDFWVCEKSDGIRVLLFVFTDNNTKDQMVYLIDRHNAYRELAGLYFPHHENPLYPLRSTIVDGELVIDVDPRTKHETLRFLAFDCLVVDDQNVMSRPLDKRYGRLNEWFHKPYARMMRDHPHMANTQPFDIKVKQIKSSYNVEQVFNVDIPALQHGNDGLIYTCVNTPYSPGTDPNIMKWKPASENSIDFKLVLRFPPLASNPTVPDFHAKPVFLLQVWCGDERGVAKYEQYDDLYVSDEEWEQMKSSGEQYDDRIIEVHWDPAASHWRMMRFRDDKPNGNHRSVVEKIIQSIADGVEKDALLARSNAIRNAWKARQGQPAANRPAAVQPPKPVPRPPPLEVERRYGPIASSPWSKVSGPETIAGMKR
ncbi:mRNA capping enzyme, catalytic domain-containing protein [Desarmillaria tabescens]|uniref:mRNA-capping enzyme subunit alpha n=1 Tax=Armillaria tabescens TaxID=1929756 RepID=A0AA39T4G0_ARMTA|nr:mRNA capping enzyme, catalytic domain-containing protein [Desarmillaria tabescens]KAK0463931.1 mRNA capping enzyme, catalytic domain-containing protein [Desarmillaria tabescens]